MNSKSRIIEELYDEFHKDVYHFALFFTNSKQDSEDITQETFIKVLKNLSQLKDSTKKKSWILSIARNTAVDLFRKQNLLRHLPKILVQENYRDTQIDESHQVIVTEEYWLELQTALLKLKPHYRSVVILRSLNELLIRETAEVLRCSQGKVRVDYHRALQELRKDVNLKEGWEYYGQSRSK